MRPTGRWSLGCAAKAREEPELPSVRPTGEYSGALWVHLGIELSGLTALGAMVLGVISIGSTLQEAI